MKTIKIGEIEVEICETAEDLPIERFTALKELVIYQETGLDTPTLTSTMQKFVQQFDSESKAGMLITLNDFVHGIGKIRDREDVDQMMFALITFEKDEDRNFTDTTKTKEKLARYAHAGLTQKMVEEITVNFIRASSARFLTSIRNNSR